MKTLYQQILNNLLDSKHLVEITIIEQNGSTPRTAGTKMLFLADGSISGTIGGGLYEAKAIEQAKNILANAENHKLYNASTLQFDLETKAKPTDMDMICGGTLRLLFEYIEASKKNIELYEHIVNIEKIGGLAVIVTKMSFGDLDRENNIILEKGLYSSVLDVHNINQSLILEVWEQIENNNFKNYFVNSFEYCFDVIKKPYTLHIFGAGHVACELAKITNFLDFKTIVLDDRAEFCNKERFAESEIVVLPSLEQGQVEEYFKSQILDEQSGIIIVTRGHARDKDVLICSLKNKSGYVGMIGSKSKKQTTYNYLLENGFNENDLQRVHSPIGLTIGAQTPEEIAISIAAELIMWRSGKL